MDWLDEEVVNAAKALSGQVSTGVNFHKDEVITSHVQDVEPILAEAKMERNYGDDGWSDGRQFKKVGSIPSIFLSNPRYADLMSDDANEFKKAAQRFFRENPEFKTSRNI